MKAHLHVESTVCAQTQGYTRLLPVKSRNKPWHQSSCFIGGVLCKSNWVEHKAPASYFCSKNALSEMMKTFFFFRSLCWSMLKTSLCARALPPKKSLFSSNCCFPKSCSLTVLHRVWQKQWEEERKLGVKGWRERKEGGWVEKKKKVSLNCTGCMSILLLFKEVLPAAVSPHSASAQEQCNALLLELLCFFAFIINPHCFTQEPPLHSCTFFFSPLTVVALWSVPTMYSTRSEKWELSLLVLN